MYYRDWVVSTRGDDMRLAEHGDIICDGSLLAGFKVRPDADFETMGASAIFKRENSGWKLTAIRGLHKAPQGRTKHREPYPSLG